MITTEDLISTLKRIEAELVRERRRRRMNWKLKERSTKFEDAFQLLDRSDDAVGLRITAVPVSDDLSLQSLSKPYGQLIDDLSRPSTKVTRLLKGQDKPLEVTPPLGFDHIFSAHGWDPILRAVRSDSHRTISTKKGEMMPTDYSYLELHRDGIVEFGFLSCMKLGEGRDGKGGYLILFPDHAVVAVAIVLSWVVSLCRFAEHPDTDYMVQAIVHTTGERTFVYSPGPERPMAYGGQMIGKIRRGVMMLPKMSFRQDTDIAALLSMFEQDLVNAVGKYYNTDLYGEFDVLDKGSRR